MNTFAKLLAGLTKCGVEYILVGGLAVDLCGFTRATMDVDILIQAGRANVERLLSCLDAFGEGSARELVAADFAMEEGCIRVVEAFPLDIFTMMSGNRFEDLITQTAVHLVEGQEIRYLNVEGLIALKSASVRPKDQLDVQALKTILKEKRG